MSSWVDTIWLVPLYPLAAFVFTLIGRSIPAIQQEGSNSKAWMPREGASILTIAATLMGLIHTVGAGIWLLAQQAPALASVETNWSWLSVGNLHLSLGTLVDAPSLMMLFVVTFISLFIQIYTHGYMSHDKGYAKFFSYLALFNFSMLGLVLATNLFQMYIFWELVGLCSYLLIGFWFHKKDAADASLKAFMVNRFGDFGFLAGILLLFAMTASVWPALLNAQPDYAILSFQGLAELAPAITTLIPEPWLAIVCVLLFMGPMAKSAQVPLHMWLPDAMAGPTPISALIHAATMVAAGVFLVGRLFPLLEQSPAAMTFITIVGVVTAVIGATIAVSQTDIKKALAYSTMSQLGYMICAMGLGAYTAALFHLFTHAFFKALLFLGSGSVIHACEDEQDMRKMGGLLGKLPITGWTYLAGSIAISGLAWSSGFWSKDEILLAAQQENLPIYIILAVTAGLTSFYMFRTFFMTFVGKYRGEAHVHKEDPAMVTSLAVLAVPSLFIGWVLSGANHDWLAFSDIITLPSLMSHAGHHAPTYFNEIANNSQLIGLGGLLLAAILYWFAPGILGFKPLKWLLTPFHQVSKNKWFFDDLLEGIVYYGYVGFAKITALFDTLVLDGLVRGTAWTVRGTGGLLRIAQSGAVQTYIAIMVLSLIGLTVWLVGSF